MRERIRFTDVVVASAALGALSLVMMPTLRHAASRTQDAGADHLLKLGTALNIYCADYDHHYPLAFAPNSSVPGMWRWNSMIRVPSGWQSGPIATPSRTADDSVAWANSIQRYLSNTNLLSDPTLPEFRSGSISYDDAVRSPIAVGFTFNGLLHSYSASSVVLPSKLPVLWQGLGPVNTLGFTYANPTLSCIMPSEPCIFDGEKKGVVGANGVMMVMVGAYTSPDQKAKFLSADLALTQQSMNTASTPQTSNPGQDPFANYDGGKGSSYWISTGNNGKMYPPLFRPDRTE